MRAVTIQTSAEFVLSPLIRFGEVVLIVTHLRSQGILSKVCERIRFARPRAVRYEVFDFLAVLFGYAISGERRLPAFYETLKPFASPFMALFGRDQAPHRSHPQRSRL